MAKATRILVAATALAVVAGGISAPAAMAANPTQTLAVDFSDRTGAFRGGASGTLYGFGDEGAPTRALINGAHITNTSQKAPYGTQHPSGDALKIEGGFFDKHGQDLYVYTQDYYPDWAYNGGQRPDDDRTYNLEDGSYTEDPNGVWDYLEVVEIVTEAVATQANDPESYVHKPFNEPDLGNWYNDWGKFKDIFLDDWKAVHDKIQEVYARNGLGPATIGGPGDGHWNPERTADFLDFSIENDVVPDIFIWHELGINNLGSFRGHLTQYRAMETERGLDPLPINITEYGMLRDMGVPGQLIQWFSMFEDEKVDAQTAYWNYAGNFSDNSARPNGANAGWWMFKWYGDLEGSDTVQVTPPRLNVADTLQGIGAVDNENKRATVLFGGTNEDVRLDLTGLDEGTFGSNVDVEVREVALTGAEGFAGAPRVIDAIDGVSLDAGALELDVATYDRYAAYQVVITPSQSRTVAADAVWTSSIEAEDTALSSASVYAQDPTAGGGWKFLASGGYDVGSFNNAGSKVDWSVEVPRDGEYRFQVIGATPGSPGRHALFVDDTFAETVQYTADLALNETSRWQYRGSTEVTVSLTAGEHVLSLRASEDGSNVLPGADITLDKFLLTDVTDGEPTNYPASTLRYYGGASVSYDGEQTRGYGAIAGDEQRADAYVHAWESGYADLAFEYATTGASSLQVDVNGRPATTLTADEAGHWKSTARIHLSEGINEVEMRSPEGVLLKQITSTRVSDADSSEISIEAEDAQLGGEAGITTVGADSGSNASGGAYVGNLGNSPSNTFRVERQDGFTAPGDYNVVVHYANAETSGEHDYNPQVVDRQLTVTEAGSPDTAASAYFRYTYSWESFWERTIPMTLNTSGGALEFGNPNAWAPNVDRVVIAPFVIGTPTTEAVEPAPTTAPPTQVPEPGETEPGASEPSATEPGATEPAETEPGATQPGAGSGNGAGNGAGNGNGNGNGSNGSDGDAVGNGNGGPLATTGASVGLPISLALLLLLGGAIVFALRKRRAAHEGGELK